MLFNTLFGAVRKVYTECRAVLSKVKKKWSAPKKAMKALETMYVEKNYIGVPRKQLIRDMIRMKEKYEFSFEEYLIYHFDQLNDEQRLEFVSDKERIRVCNAINPKENISIFNNKILTYFVFKKYYGREIIDFRSKKNEEKRFLAFYEKNKDFVVKRLHGSFGKGFLKLQSSAGNGSKTYVELCSLYKEGFIVEELIRSCEELAAFHPKSLNTLRMPVIKYNDRCEVIHPFMRFGQGEAIVDNAGAGGIFCYVDTQTGSITAAVDEKGHHYIEHPDSHLKFIGYKIPRFDEAVELAKEMMEVIPNNRYVGFDLALTEKGWVMVEGNIRGQFVWQMATHKGFKKELTQILKEIGYND